MSRQDLHSSSRLNRRNFLRLAGLGVAGTAVAACTLATPAAVPASTAEPAKVAPTDVPEVAPIVPDAAAPEVPAKIGDNKAGICLPHKLLRGSSFGARHSNAEHSRLPDPQ